MLKLTPKEKVFLSQFIGKRFPDLGFELVRFKTEKDKQDFIENELCHVTDISSKIDTDYNDLIFCRREYDGSELYLYIYDNLNPKIYSLKTKKGGIENETEKKR